LKKSVIIVAGGTGTRMDSALPKQFLLLGHKPILIHAINAFVQVFPDISVVVALPLAYTDGWNELCRRYTFTQPHKVVQGGETRFHSVKNALSVIPPDHLVAIHDSARPLVTPSLIMRVFQAALQFGNAVPVLPVTESLRIINDSGNRSIDRNLYRVVQTPQVFSCQTLKKAYEAGFEKTFTDDATVIEKLGEKIHLLEGEKTNIKITQPSDLVIAGLLLKKMNIII